jgi:hypothetical protein
MKPPAPPAPPNHSVPVGHAHSGPLCFDCKMPMQLFNELTDGGKVIARSYICHCGGRVKYHNEHAGQSGRPA